MRELWREGVASPCVNICELDGSDTCVGCYRTREEIACWSLASDAEKQAILEKVAARKTVFNSF